MNDSAPRSDRDATRHEQATFQIDRTARVLVTGSDQARRLAQAAIIVELGAGETWRPDPPCDLVIRQGNLRVLEQLADGRQVTRAVLQTGMVARLRPAPDGVSEPVDSSLYSLEALELTALTETEIWRLATGACDPA
jgi:hypothetical protein